MAFSSETGTHGRNPLIATSIAALIRVRTKAKAVLKTLQLARMISTLSSMSDHQLAQIGITRSDIPKYAEELMADQ
ncbi:MAG: DUF1127 domain-containing protein [Boseongicola sp.]|nr:DUF1127 domain-containing protein [Boseongicola sp.]NNE88858.1 DUF1127 domain-containing protein [Silicimonas sp.]NNL17572.1 DUF1127 domain-containing protein [Boseongicola sp.]